MKCTAKSACKEQDYPCLGFRIKEKAENVICSFPGMKKLDDDDDSS